MAEVVNAIVADAPVTGVRIITDSWGLCEPAVSPAAAAATNSALQLAAVSGITFVAASGDAGAYDCGGFRQLAVDDPAAQPFATGVGGTDLRLSASGSRHEVVWNDITGAGGGGLSRFWPRPAWQAGAGVSNRFSNGHRQVPDVSLHASAAQHGYPVYCTTGACGHAGWMTLGGTSASAPLLAGIVADMNSYSLAHGGARLGFANPFLYDSSHRRSRRVPRRHQRQQQSRRRRAVPGHARLRPGERHRRTAGRCAGRRPGRVRARSAGVRRNPDLGAAVRCQDAAARALHHPARRAQRCRGRHRRGSRVRPGRLGDRRSRVAAHHRRPRRLVAEAAGAVPPHALARRLPGVGDDCGRRSPTAARST